MALLDNIRWGERARLMTRVESVYHMAEAPDRTAFCGTIVDSIEKELPRDAHLCSECVRVLLEVIDEELREIRDKLSVLAQ